MRLPFESVRAVHANSGMGRGGQGRAARSPAVGAPSSAASRHRQTRKPLPPLKPSPAWQVYPCEQQKPPCQGPTAPLHAPKRAQSPPSPPHWPPGLMTKVQVGGAPGRRDWRTCWAWVSRRGRRRRERRGAGAAAWLPPPRRRRRRRWAASAGGSAADVAMLLAVARARARAPGDESLGRSRSQYPREMMFGGVQRLARPRAEIEVRGEEERARAERPSRRRARAERGRIG